ncbi:hypothetical protein C8R44DRAFT_916924 [Mycena epipterygia]|nr:hypothetical protein C8R44DRAFT_916924 [Mycena epipterygia]
MRRFEIPAMAPPKAKTTPPMALKTEAPGRTKEEKRQKENERKREQKERRATRSNNTPTLPATSASLPQLLPPTMDKTISTPSPTIRPISPLHPQPTYLKARSTCVLPTAAFISVPPSVPDIPPVPQSVFDDYRDLLDEHEEDFVAANDADYCTLEGLLSLALNIGWRVGWQLGRDSGILSGKEEGRCEGIVEGRHTVLVQGKAQLPPVTHAAAVIILSKEPLTVAAETVVPPLCIPVPLILLVLFNGGLHIHGTLAHMLRKNRFQSLLIPSLHGDIPRVYQATNPSRQRRFHYRRIRAVDVSVVFSIGIVILFYQIWGEHWELLGGLEEVKRVPGSEGTTLQVGWAHGAVALGHSSLGPHPGCSNVELVAPQDVLDRPKADFEVACNVDHKLLCVVRNIFLGASGHGDLNCVDMWSGWIQFCGAELWKTDVRSNKGPNDYEDIFKEPSEKF